MSAVPHLPPHQPPTPRPPAATKGYRVGAWSEFEASPEPAAAYDALAELFLGGSKAAANAAPAAMPPTGHTASHVNLATPRTAIEHHGPRRAAVLCLLAGHLLPLSAAWAYQRAQQLAEQSRKPVAMLYVGTDRTELALVGAAPAAPAANLDEAIAAAAALTDTWLVRSDAATAPALATGGVDALHVMTAADEAAILASYRSIKSLVREGSPRGPLPPVEVCVVGTSGDRARSAAERLHRTIGTQLAHAATLGPIMPRLDPTASAGPIAWFTGPAADPAELVSRLRRAAHGPAQPSLPATSSMTPTSAMSGVAASDPIDAPRTTAPAALRFTVSPTRTNHMASHAPGVMTPAVAPTPTPRPAAVDPLDPLDGLGASASTPIHAPPDASHNLHAAPPPRRAAGALRGAPSEVLARPAGEPPKAARLSARLPQLVHLGPLCTRAPGVDFALDAQGVVHLLTGLEAAEPIDAALGRLYVASVAIDELRPSLTLLAEREVAGLARERPPIMHVFTSRPETVRPLLAGPARVHLRTAGPDTGGPDAYVEIA